MLTSNGVVFFLNELISIFKMSVLTVNVKNRDSYKSMNQNFLGLSTSFWRFCLFLDRGEGRGKERKRRINVWLPLKRPLLGTWPATQACALTRNRTGDLLVHRPALNPLSHTAQGGIANIFKWVKDPTIQRLENHRGRKTLIKKILDLWL